MISWLKTQWRVSSAQSALTECLGIWVIDDKQLHGLFETMRLALPTVSGSDIRDARKRSQERSAAAPELVVERGVARIPIAGPIMREVPCIFELFGIEATSTTRTQQLIRDATASDEVKSILYEFNTPGGTLDGTASLADVMFEARSAKPSHGHATGMIASAGYWAGAQIDRLTSEATTIVGSIGVYSVIEDLSARAAQEGVKVHVVRSGPHKGAGIEGSEVTPAMLAVEQEIIDRAREMFVEAILRGRGAKLPREKLEQLATGRVWLGADAAQLGLTDGTESIEAAREGAAIHPTKAPSAGGNMPNTPTTPGAAAPSAPTTPPPATPTVALTANDELEQLRARAAKAEAERDLAKQALDDYRWSALDEVITSHAKAGRVAPTDRPEVERLARAAYLTEKDGPKKLDAELAKRRQVTKPQPAVLPDEVPDAPDADAQAAITDAAIRAKLHATHVEIARQMGVSVELVQAASKATGGMGSDLKARDADGKVVEIPSANNKPQPSA